MIMTNEEIARDYRTAKAPMKQIDILAELNGCTKDEIKRILIEQGEKLPGNMVKKPKPEFEFHQDEKPILTPVPKNSNDLSIYHQAIATIGDIILLSDRGGCGDIKEAVRGVLYMVFAATEGK